MACRHQPGYLALYERRLSEGIDPSDPTQADGVLMVRPARVMRRASIDLDVDFQPPGVSGVVGIHVQREDAMVLPFAEKFVIRVQEVEA